MNCDIKLADKLLKDKKIEFSDKILILIDGFDEVRHKDQQMGKEKTIFGAIMDDITSMDKNYHVIMTTRPNAIDKKLR